MQPGDTGNENEKGGSGLVAVLAAGGFGESQYDAAFEAGETWVELGSGSYSEVFKGQWGSPGQCLVLKKLDNSYDRVNAMFAREVVALTIAAAAGTPYIVRLVACSPPQQTIITEYCGRDMRWRHDRGTVKFKHVKVVKNCIAAAVMHLRRNGMAHRDIKPENIVLNDRGEEEAKLIDCGWSAAVPTPVPDTDNLWKNSATRDYAPPCYMDGWLSDKANVMRDRLARGGLATQEEVFGRLLVCSAHDLFALSLTLVELATGTSEGRTNDLRLCEEYRRYCEKPLLRGRGSYKAWEKARISLQQCAACSPINGMLGPSRMSFVRSDLDTTAFTMVTGLRGEPTLFESMSGLFPYGRYSHARKVKRDCHSKCVNGLKSSCY